MAAIVALVFGLSGTGASTAALPEGGTLLGSSQGKVSAPEPPTTIACIAATQTYHRAVPRVQGDSEPVAWQGVPAPSTAPRPDTPDWSAPGGVAAKTVPDEGVYVVRNSEGEVCVGQSGNIPKRLGQHVSKGKFTQADADAAERIEVLGGKKAREIEEQLKLDSLGGKKGPNVVNKVNPIGDRRLDLMPAGYRRP